MLQRLTRLSHEYLEAVQKVIGSPLWVMGNIVLFSLWMLAMLVWQLVTGHAFDSPLMFFPGTVWAMTVLGYFIELAMKAQTNALQRIQNEQDAKMSQQIDRIESVVRESAKRDEVMREMILTINATANLVLHWLRENEDGDVNVDGH